MKGLIFNTLNDYENKQQQIVDLLELKCRYCGQVGSPDIVLTDGTFVVPFFDDPRIAHLNWQEIDDNLIKKDAEFN